MKKNLITSILMTLTTTLLLGIAYPLLVTGLAQLLFKDKANGQLISRDGKVVGSRIIGQAFIGPAYFHSRPSAGGRAGVGPQRAGHPGDPVPIDLVTASASGLDPDISPAAADFQVERVARERKLSEADVSRMVREHTSSPQWGLLGEPRVNVLELNLALDARTSLH